MPEIETPATTVRVDYHCDECGEPMAYTGVCLPMHPPLFVHECKNGHTAKLGARYPLHRHIP